MSLARLNRPLAALAALLFLAITAGGAGAQRAADLEAIRATAPPPPPLAPDATLAIQIGPTPVWISSDVTRVSTGGALADIDADQDLDFVISNGNDMAMQPRTMYRNTGGMLGTTPAWTSADNYYSGHCAVGDVDGDGRPDLAVANYGGGSQPFPPQRSILYRNLGTQFEATASWQTSDLDNSFSLAFGDVDLDGDLDLAFANGEAYSSNPARNDLYLCQGGALGLLPAWQSTEIESSYDVAWADVDRDGDLDLATINSMAPLRLYQNQGGMLGATAVWSSTIAEDGNSIAFGDVNGDGWLDLAAATNRQIGGTGRFYVFINQGGVLAAAPSWTSNVGNVYGSAVAFADLDADGDEDLAAGVWWGRVMVFENLGGGTLTTGAAWTSQTTSVIEAIVPGDVDLDGLRPRSDALPAGGGRRLFYVTRRPIQRLVEVRADGVPLAPGSFACDLDQGWISVPVAPAQSLAVDYWVSDDLDLAVTNWDNTIGNYLFANQRPTTGLLASPARGAEGLRIAPLPARSGSMVTITGAPAAAELRVITAGGRVLARLEAAASGEARFEARGPGILWVVGPRGEAVRLVVLP